MPAWKTAGKSRCYLIYSQANFSGFAVRHDTVMSNSPPQTVNSRGYAQIPSKFQFTASSQCDIWHGKTVAILALPLMRPGMNNNHSNLQ